jgi:hypothetical protein
MAFNDVSKLQSKTGRNSAFIIIIVIVRIGGFLAPNDL